MCDVLVVKNTLITAIITLVCINNLSLRELTGVDNFVLFAFICEISVLDGNTALH